VLNILSAILLSKNIQIKIHRIIILPFVLYGCETWALPLREELKLKVFESRVLRKIFGLKRGMRRTTQRTALGSVLLTKYYSGDEIKNNEIGGAYSMYGRQERCKQGFGVQTSGKETSWKILM
jgi:hypothetical protein